MELRVEHIHKTYGPLVILEDITFSLSKGQKVGLIGSNGTGKSTLLKILTGAVEPDRGEIVGRKGVVVGYMPQDTSLAIDEPIRDYLRRVSGIAELEERMGTSAEALSQYELRDGYSFDHRADMVLAGFGLNKISADRLVSSLSSGQKSKVFLAGVLLSDPDVLLLDEPTNNLDLPALIWLEDFLIRSKAACIIVSHDRLFLDRIVKKIFEIDRDTRELVITSGKYSDYLERKEKERNRLFAAHEAQKDEITRLTESVRAKKADAIRGSGYVGTDNDKFARGFKRDRASKSAKTAKAIEKRIEQMEVIEKPVEHDAFVIQINPAAAEGSRDIYVRDVGAGYAETGFKIGPVSLNVSFGSRLAIMGLNGSGKSTLLKTLSGALPPLAGDVEVGKGLVVGNMTQEHDNLPRQESIKDFLMRRAKLELSEAYALATRYGFKAEEIDKGIGELSPGGRARLLFALFSALSVNVLLLDEPTNHLDLEALEALEEAVRGFRGTVLLVSHDRTFLEKFRATDTYVLSSGRLSRQVSFETYLSDAEREAKRLINML